MRLLGLLGLCILHARLDPLRRLGTILRRLLRMAGHTIDQRIQAETTLLLRICCTTLRLLLLRRGRCRLLLLLATLMTLSRFTQTHDCIL